jgi:poly-gamma-glutamate capsule biosynthesis protein CapA/YwtB (metallophosphatase superfamily)
MLGRGVARSLEEGPAHALASEEVVAAARGADLFVLNLECCISERGTKWPAPGKPFFFRAPPRAVEFLVHFGVDCVTLANNHALDFGEEALLDTITYLDAAGIAHVGAGADVHAARAPAVLEATGFRLGVVGLTDHPEDFAAGEDRAGVAFSDLRDGLPPWIPKVVQSLSVDAVLVTPHWGPNMNPEPLPRIRRAAAELAECGATFVAGHSAHVFQGVRENVLFDLGDFLDDYAVDPILRNDLGVLVFVTLDDRGPVRIEALPLKLDICSTRVADGEDDAWIRRRFKEACASFGTGVTERDGRLVVSLR